MKKRDLRKKLNEGRCRICRKLIDPIYDSNHFERCLEKHHLKKCPTCNQLVRADNLQAHIRIVHSTSPQSVSDDDADFELGELTFEEVKRVPWRILPPGKDGFQWLQRHFNEDSRRNQARYEEQRLRAFSELDPDEIYIGDNEFDGYVVFVFVLPTHSLAVLENPYYGHAKYMIRGGWQELSQLPKRQLMDKKAKHIMRWTHVDGHQGLVEVLGHILKEKWH